MTKRPPKRHAAKAAEAVPSKRGVFIGEEELRILQQKLDEARETLDAIRNGEVDAVVVNGSHGSQIYSLAGAEQPYRVYVESMQEGAVTVSSHGLILYCNQRFAQMVGVPLKRVISSDIDRYIGAEMWQKLSAVFGTKDSVKHEAILRCAKKRTLTVNLSASDLPLEDQAVMCLVVTDLSAQQENVALRHARDEAEKASSAKDAFLAALSHELRTPLTPALLTATALEKEPSLPEHLRQDVEMIRRNVELETRLIDDLLDLTRIANNKLELHTEPLDLHAVLSRAWDICRPEIQQKSLKVDVQMGARESKLNGDSVRLQQALWNLIRNAVKFTPSGGSISIITDNPHKNHIRVQVNDTGVGFAPDAGQTLFEAFAQGGRSITRQFGGLGLGLAITRSIVEAHGGGIRAESKGLHRGATFAVELPVERMGNSKGSVPQLKEKAPSISSRSLRILLVEDHDDTRKSMERLLKRFGHKVGAASTAAKGLEMAAAEPFDLVISDIGLPDLSGEDLMSELRDRFGLIGVAVSGYGMEADIARCRIGGFAHHLTKPIQIEHLKRIISEVSEQVEK